MVSRRQMLRVMRSKRRDVRASQSSDVLRVTYSRLLGLKQLESKKTPIEKYIYLSNLRNTNVHLFYRLVMNNLTVSAIVGARDQV